MKDKCSSCGAENEEYENVSDNNEVLLPFYMERRCYRCWYCGHLWVNLELKKHE